MPDSPTQQLESALNAEKVTANLGSRVTLGSLLEGRLEVLFHHYVSAILANIRDTDTLPTAMRSITLGMTFEPKNGREYAIADITMKCSCFGHIAPMKVGFYITGRGTTAAMQEQPGDFLVEPLARSAGTAHSISMAGLYRGGVDELFQQELQLVAANIRDVNKVQSAKRTLSVKFSFKPSEGRNYAGLGIKVASSCTGHNEPLLSALYIENQQGVITAREQFVEQKTLFSQ